MSHHHDALKLLEQVWHPLFFTLLGDVCPPSLYLHFRTSLPPIRVTGCAKQLSLVTCLCRFCLRPTLPLDGKPLLAVRLGSILFMQVPNALLCRHRGSPPLGWALQTVITPHRNHRILAAASGAEEWKFFFFGPQPSWFCLTELTALCKPFDHSQWRFEMRCPCSFFSGGPSAWRVFCPCWDIGYTVRFFICFWLISSTCVGIADSPRAKRKPTCMIVLNNIFESVCVCLCLGGGWAVGQCVHQASCFHTELVPGDPVWSPPNAILDNQKGNILELVPLSYCVWKCLLLIFSLLALPRWTRVLFK